MRLLVVSTEFPPGPGGIGTHAYQIAKHLQRLGWEVTVVTKQDNAGQDEIRAFNESQSFRVITVEPQPHKAFKFLAWLRNTSASARNWKPDALLASGISAVLVAALVARFYRLPFTVVTHGEFPGPWKLPWLRWSCRQSKALICVSEYTRLQMKSIGVYSKITKVIPNGGDPCVFKPLPESEIQDFRRSLGMTDAAILLTVGKVSERKGQDAVIRALPHILRKVPNTHYFVVGFPARQAQFANLAKELGVSEFVHFTGALNSKDLVRYLNSCNVFVMLSRHLPREYEAYGIAVVEAALCGKPAVVSANSGVRESILPGVTGLTAPEGDAMAAADAILTLIQNEQLRIRFGEDARSAALETGTWENRVRCYDELLREILQLERA